ncbi:MAG: MarR family winged helix-turn-helix transcriptional regulator [Clostridia bacterium]
MPLPTTQYVRLAAFRAALRNFLHFSDAEAGRMGLSSQQYQALLAVRASGDERPPTINDLARQLFIKHNSAVGLVDRLAEQGLVRRRPVAGDRRKVCLRITTKGRRVLARLASLHRAELRRVAPVMGRVLRELGH